MYTPNKVRPSTSAHHINAEISRAMLVVTALLSSLFLAVVSSAQPVNAHGKDVIILKFKESFAKEMEKSLPRADMVLRGAPPSPPVAAFFARYGLREISPLYPALLKRKISSGRPADALAEDVKKKFPVRARRNASRISTPDLTRTYVAKVNGDLQGVLSRLGENPVVEYAEENWEARPQWVPNDPHFTSDSLFGPAYSNLWGLFAIGCHPFGWTRTPPGYFLVTGEGIVVAVLDSGVDYNHPDLADNIWHNTGEIPNNGIDDDNNGFVDDTIGWNFVGQYSVNYPTPTNDPSDSDPGLIGHGTRMAGTIAATGNNGIGIIGVAFGAKIMPVKVLGVGGAVPYNPYAQGIQYAAENGADVMNMSWGAPSNSAAIEEAMQYAASLGCIMVSCAGNDNGAVWYPATSQYSMAVAAIDPYGFRASFSNFGNEIDVAAPGVNILSTVPGGGYAAAGGTSMAAPHVAGVAALVLQAYPNSYSATDVINKICNTAEDLGANGWDAYTGYGLVSAYGALIPPPVYPVVLNVEGYIDYGDVEDGNQNDEYSFHVPGPGTLTYYFQYAGDLFVAGPSQVYEAGDYPVSVYRNGWNGGYYSLSIEFTPDQ